MSLLWQRVQHNKKRLLSTASLALGFLVDGMLVGSIGPSLEDLRQQVQCSVPSISFIVTMVAIGNGIGSAVYGTIHTRINFLISASIIWLAAAVILLSVAFVRELSILLTAYFMLGFANGMFETGKSIAISTLWVEKNTPFRQAVYLMSGLGAAIGSLIVEPFLMKRPENDSVSNSTLPEIFHPELVNLIHPHSVISFGFVLSAFSSILCWKYCRESNDDSDAGEEQILANAVWFDVDAHHESSTKQKSFLMILFFLFCVFLFAIDSSMLSFTSYFTTSSRLHLTPATGAYLTSAYAASSLVVGAASVYYVQLLGLEASLLLNVSLLLISNLLFAPFCQSHEILLWMSVVLNGAGVSTSIPCMYSYTEQQFPVMPMIASLLGISSMAANLFFPVFISNFIIYYPQSFHWTNLFCSSCLFVILVVILVWRRKNPMC